MNARSPLLALLVLSASPVLAASARVRLGAQARPAAPLPAMPRSVPAETRDAGLAAWSALIEKTPSLSHLSPLDLAGTLGAPGDIARAGDGMAIQQAIRRAVTAQADRDVRLILERAGKPGLDTARVQLTVARLNRLRDAVSYKGTSERLAALAGLFDALAEKDLLDDAVVVGDPQFGERLTVVTREKDGVIGVYASAAAGDAPAAYLRSLASADPAARKAAKTPLRVSVAIDRAMSSKGPSARAAAAGRAAAERFARAWTKVRGSAGWTAAVALAGTAWASFMTYKAVAAGALWAAPVSLHLIANLALLGSLGAFAAAGALSFLLARLLLGTAKGSLVRSGLVFAGMVAALFVAFTALIPVVPFALAPLLVHGVAGAAIGIIAAAARWAAESDS